MLRPQLCSYLLSFSLVLVVCMAAGCASTQVAVAETEAATEFITLQEGPAQVEDWMHTPMRPLDHEGITFSLAGSSDAGTETVELHVYEYELYRDKEGRPGQRARSGGQWGLLYAWTPQHEETNFNYELAYEAGFGPHTRVEYVWRIVDINGDVSDRLARFDAGTSPWPEDKVLLYSASRQSMSQTIDIGFFRDTDYRDSLALYRSDVEAMVRKGFLAESAFGRDREHWAFYTTDRSADGGAISADISNSDLLPEFLKDFSIPGIDAFCLLHREQYTDRSLLLENFHALSNNLFSAEAYNYGTAVHECGHAIFHLSDEYSGCACFQTHSTSNVFRESEDCVAWNLTNGFPASDCHELRDMYDRPWFSAEEATFFTSEAQCREHNATLGVSEDSCRTFVDELGTVKIWAFEATCIMHDDGDHVVRPFQRACRRVIDDFYPRLSTGAGAIASRPRVPENTELGVATAERTFAATQYENIYGYEPVVTLAMTRQDELWSLRVEDASMGVPTSSTLQSGEVVMRVLDTAGQAVETYHLAEPGAVHAHGEDRDAYEVPSTGTIRVAVPASRGLAMVACEFDAQRAARSANPAPITYREGFVFELAKDVAAAIDELERRIGRN